MLQLLLPPLLSLSLAVGQEPPPPADTDPQQAEAAPSPAAQEEPGAFYENPEYGFRVERPDAGWMFQETPTPAAASLVLNLNPIRLGGRVQARFTVEKRQEPADPAGRRQMILDYVAATDGISNVRSIEVKAAGASWPGIRLEQAAPGAGTFAVQQVYLAQGLLLYTIQFHAPAGEFEEHEQSFTHILDSFAFTELSEAGRKELELHRLAALCGSELDWAADWAAAAARAADEDKLVLVYVRSYPGMSITDDTFAGHFSDPDLVELVGARFVPLRFQVLMDAPFKAQSSYGMSPTTFGNSFLLVDSGGEVRSERFAGVPSAAIYDWLLDWLKSSPGHSPPPPEDAGAIALARWHVRNGQLKRAVQTLADDRSGEAALIRASILRRQRRAEAALAELARVDRADDPQVTRLASGERARLLLGLGRADEAARVMEELSSGEDELAAEALYGLAIIRLSQVDQEGATRFLERVLEEHPGSRWCWLAAAGLTSTYLDAGIPFSLGWPSPELFAALEMPEPEPLAVGRAREARNDALRYLLRTQRQDGSWICPGEIGGDSEKPNHLTLAITAICGEALLSHWEDDAAAPAVLRAVEYVLATWKRMASEPQPEFFMDYTVWSDAYLLSFLGAARQAGVGESGSVEMTMRAIVDDVARRQKSGGGWSYYLTPDLERAGDPLDISMSFTTAAMLLGLSQAQEAGTAVPQGLVEKGLGCLERMRNPDGTFEYMINHAQESAPRKTGEGGAAGRGPVCELALLRHGRGSLDAVRAALDRFARHRRSLAKERRKALMHCGPEAQGSHYVMFDYLTSAQAVAALPEERQRDYRVMLLEEILGARNADGSYLDNPMIGPAFGAGAALQAFQSLEPLPSDG